MAGRYSSLTRSFMSSATRASARPSSIRSPSTSLPRLRPSPTSAPRRRFSFAPSRNLGELGCMQSFLPFTSSVAMTSYLSVQARACCELYHGTFCRTCQDR